MDPFSRDFWVSEPLFGDILVSWSHFFVICWVLGRVWRLGGSLGCQSGRHWRNDPIQQTTFGIMLGNFFDEQVVYVLCCLLYAFLDAVV